MDKGEGMKALITGITGQDGAYLAKLLLENGWSVDGGLRRSASDSFWRLNKLGILGKIRLVDFDLMDPYSIADLVRLGKYDHIYNLAAQSFVGVSWQIPLATSQANGMGVVALLDAVRRFSPETRLYQASTSEMFGKIQEPIQSERTPFYPRSPYGVAKLFAHQMGINYRESFSLFVSNGILFNHESPLRGSEFVTKKISTGLANFKLNGSEAIELGNLNAERDWGYAPEYVEGMHRMLSHDVADDFVLATGKKLTVREFVNSAAEALSLEISWEGQGLEEVAVEKGTAKVVIRVKPEFYRPAEVDVLLGDYGKAHRTLGWKPATYAHELAAIMAVADYELALERARK